MQYMNLKELYLLLCIICWKWHNCHIPALHAWLPLLSSQKWIQSFSQTKLPIKCHGLFGAEITEEAPTLIGIGSVKYLLEIFEMWTWLSSCFERNEFISNDKYLQKFWMFFLWSTVIRFNFIQSQGFFFWVQKVIVVTPPSHIFRFLSARSASSALRNDFSSFPSSALF